MKRLAIALLPLAGCVTTAEPPAVCDAAPPSALIGRPGTATLAAEARTASGARSVRWKAPGRQVTMDYRPDRLTISLDEQGTVTAFGCG